MGSSHEETFTLDGGATLGRALHGVVHWPTGNGPHPWTVIVHGFKGFMDWGSFPFLAERLRAAGIAAVRFNLSGSGVLPGSDRFDDEEAFEADTFAGQCRDVRTVVEWTRSRVRGSGDRRLAPERGSLLGHSRGGGVSVLVAARDPALRALVLWAPIDRIDRYDAATREAWRRDGVLRVPNARTGQVHRLGLALLEEAESRDASLDVLAAAERVAVPTLLVQGTADESVSVEESRRIAARLPDAELVEIDGAGHTFGAAHPFRGSTAALDEAVERSVAHLRQHLRPSRS